MCPVSLLSHFHMKSLRVYYLIKRKNYLPKCSILEQAYGDSTKVLFIIILLLKLRIFTKHMDAGSLHCIAGYILCLKKMVKQKPTGKNMNSAYLRILQQGSEVKTQSV